MATTPMMPTRSDQAMRQPPRVSEANHWANFTTIDHATAARGGGGGENLRLWRGANKASLRHRSLPLHLAELEAVVMGGERLGGGGAGRHAQLEFGRQLQLQGFEVGPV